MTQDEQDRKDLVYEIAKLYSESSLAPGACDSGIYLLGCLAIGKSIRLSLRFPAMQLIKKKSPLVWERLFKYIAQGYVKP
jgi:hypothetical protein